MYGLNQYLQKAKNKMELSIVSVSDNAEAILLVKDLLNFVFHSFLIVVVLDAYIEIDITIRAIVIDTMCVNLISIYRQWKIR